MLDGYDNTRGDDRDRWRDADIQAPASSRPTLPLAHDIVASLSAVLNSPAYARAEAADLDTPFGDDGESDRTAAGAPAELAAPVELIAPTEFAAPAIAPPSRRRAARVNGKALTWAGLGFLSGALAWHMVGFWNFVSAVAFNGDVREDALPAFVEFIMPAKREQPHSELTTGSINRFAARSTSGGGCVTVHREQNTGDVLHAACPTDQRPLRDAGRQNREDRLHDASQRAASPTTWASTTETHTEIEPDVSLSVHSEMPEIDSLALP